MSEQDMLISEEGQKAISLANAQKVKIAKLQADLAVAKEKNEVLKNIISTAISLITKPKNQRLIVERLSIEGVKNWSNKQAQRLAELEGENDKVKE